MEWLASNWVWIAIVVGFIALHRFGHGGHGHHSHSRERPDRDPTQAGAALPPEGAAGTHTAHGQAPSTEGQRQHRHGC